MKKRILIKLGGAALKAPHAMTLAVETIRHYRESGNQVIIVHGGGPAINNELLRLGIQWEFIGGQRVTTPRMMEVIETTLCGGVNKPLVRFFGSCGLPAVGFSGVDFNLLVCTQSSVELGQVGSIQEVNSAWLNSILDLPTAPLPVIAPVGVGYNGEAFNINADWAASHLAVVLKVNQLLFITDQVGITDEEGEVIESVDIRGLENMIECKIVSGGMLTKVRAVLHALKNGVSSVAITNAEAAAASIPFGHRRTTCTSHIMEKLESTYATV